MIRQILGWLLAAIIVIAIIAWIMSGGLSRAIGYARSLSDFGSYLSVNATSTGQPFKLPGQPDFSNTVGNSLHTDTGYTDSAPPYDDGSYQPDWNQGTPQPNTPTGQSGAPAVDPRTFGNPSPYAGYVGFVAHNTTGSAASEYLVIQSARALPAPISLAGWSLQSALTGASILLPQASELFVQGTLNASGPAVLQDDTTAIIASAVSPVGVSFHANRCSGYLAQLQRFDPAIAPSCPLAHEYPALGSIDPQCLSYLDSVPACHFPGGADAQNPAVPAACRSAAAEALSYNGCVNAFKAAPDFALPEWRLYLAVAQPLWKIPHDTIRLLDNEGRVVDVVSY